MTLRSTGLVIAVMFAAPVVAEAQSEVSRPAVYVALPVTNGFTDATHALIETQALIRESLKASDLHVVATQEEADVVLTVLGRGRGDVELTAALQALDSAVNA